MTDCRQKVSLLILIILVILFRTRRSSANEESGSILGLVESLDKSNCAKQLVCQIHAKEVAARSQEEAVIIAMFGKAPGVAASKIPLAEFEIAAKIGASSRSDAVCQEAYTSCPYSARQIMQLFKSLWRAWDFSITFLMITYLCIYSTQYFPYSEYLKWVSSRDFEHFPAVP